MIESVANWFHSGLNFLSPPQCLGCYCVLTDTQISNNDKFCDLCSELLFPMPENYCVKCGAPLGPHIESEQGCYHCKDDSFAFESVVSLDSHHGLLRELCIRSKKSINSSAAKFLWQILYEKHQQQINAWEIDTVIPVPSHWRDRLGMQNVAPEEIAQVAGRSLRVPVSRNILGKRRRTAKQSTLSPTERRKNLRGVFRVKGSPRLNGLNVLLVDDILTTGSTCHEVSKTLRKSGVDRVYVAVIARGVGAESI